MQKTLIKTLIVITFTLSLFHLVNAENPPEEAPSYMPEYHPNPRPMAVDIHGLPIARKKPQQEEEIDQPKSMFEIGADNLLPKYSVTDISIPVGGSDELKLELRRNYFPSSNKIGMAPMFFGNTWNTNIFAIAYVNYEDNKIWVRDEDSSIYRFESDGKPIVNSAPEALAAQMEVNYDQDNDLITWKKKFGTTYTFAHKVYMAHLNNNVVYLLSSITDRNGNTIEYCYESEDAKFPYEIRDAAHPEKKISITYTLVGSNPDYWNQYRITSVSDPYGNTWHYEYTSDYRFLKKITSPPLPVVSEDNLQEPQLLPTTTSFEYNSYVMDSETSPVSLMYAMTSLTDPENNKIDFTFQIWENPDPDRENDKNFLLKTVTSTDGTANFEMITKTDALWQTKITDTKTNVWDYMWTEPCIVRAFLKLTRTLNSTDPVIWEYTLNEDSHAINLTSVTDQNNIKYIYKYGTVDGYNHSSANNVYKEIIAPDSLAITTEYGYDPDTNLIKRIVSPRGFTTSYTMDANGNRIIETGPENKTLRFEYDSTGFMTKSIDPDKRVTQFSRTYTTDGWTDTTTVKGYTDELNITSSKTFNLRGEMISETDANENTTNYEYDAMGSLLKITKPSVFDSESGTDVSPEILITRDANRQFLAKKNERNKWTYYKYDALYRLIEKRVDMPLDDIVTTITYDANGNKASVTDPNGTVTQFGYDAANRLISETADPAGLNLVKSYEYGINSGNDVFGDSGFLPTKITDRKGITEEFVYDNAYRLTSHKRDGITLTENEYDAAGNVTKTTAHNTIGNQIVDFVYDNLNRKIKQTVDPAGLNLITQTEYDLAGNVTAVIDPELKRSETTYDGAGRAVTQIVKMSLGGDIVSKSTYDDNGNVLSSTLLNDTGSGNQTTTSTYDAWNRLLTVTDPEGKTESVKYDLSSNKTEVTDKNGNVTTMVYDDANRLIETTLPQVADAENSGTLTNPVTTQTYDKNSNVLTATDARGTVTTNVYDVLNRVTSTIADSAGIAVESIFTYDNNSNKITETLIGRESEEGPADLVTKYQYDNFNRVISVEDPLGEVESYTYDTIGNKLTVKDKRDNTTDFEYDKTNRLIKTTLPEITCYTTGDDIGTAVRPETTTVYLKNSWVSSVTDANGNTSTTIYDDAGRKIKVTNAENEVIDYTYDKAGNILTQTVRNSTDGGSGDQVTSYSYDKRNLLLSETLMPGDTTLERITSYTYDNLGNKATRTLPDTNLTAYSYDALNRLINEAYTGASGENRSYTYNLNGAVIEAVDASGKTLYTYDALGRIITETKKDLSDLVLSVVSSQYDKAGNRTQVTYPGGRTLNFTYDKRNLLSTIQDGTDLTTYSYDENGNRTTLILPNGVVTTTSFDPANRVIQLTNYDGSLNNVYTTDYRMDKVGNRLKIVETRGAAVRNLLYTYDNIYRLTSENDDISGSSVVTAYSFDHAGNRLSKTVTGSPAVTYTVDQLNRVTALTDGSNTTAYTYDLNGNRLTKNDGSVTHHYVYDRENRLVSVNDGTNTIFSSVYDYRTRRISKLENSTTTYYIYDGGVNVQELDSARSLTKQLIRGTGMGGGIGSVLYTETVQNSTVTKTEYFCYTAIGSVVAMTDANGAVTSTTSYEAFGKEVASTGSTDETRKFCTKERSASIGLDNFGFRYYDPELGRFITRDPSGYPDGANNYLYCHNNPINFVDPEGLVENTVGGYFKEMGNVFLGYKDAAVSTVTGVATVVAHPVNTAKALGNAAMHPVDTAKAIANDYGDKLKTTRGQGSIVGEILIDVATGGTVKAVSKSGKVGSLLNKIANKSKTLKKILNKTDDVVNKLDDVANKADDVVNAADNIKVNQIKGKVGEFNSGINKNTKRIPSASGKKQYRIPDGMDDAQRHIQEVKNVNKQGLTSQLKDDIAHVNRGGGKGTVDVIVDKRTKISKPLKKAHKAKDNPINIIRKDLNK